MTNNKIKRTCAKEEWNKINKINSKTNNTNKKYMKLFLLKERLYNAKAYDNEKKAIAKPNQAMYLDIPI